MSFRRWLADAVVWGAGHCAQKRLIAEPASLFVLRNNDIGDLLVITPLFEALRNRFPVANICAGIGDWNRPVLENNPHISKVLHCNAPWHNKAIFPQTTFQALRYIFFSGESRALEARHFDLGIDVLGSPFGSLLMISAGIPVRLGVKGYAGGHLGVHRFVKFNPDEHVGRSALRFAELLGAANLPTNRPRIFLTEAEVVQAETTWISLSNHKPSYRILLGPGAGFAEKSWPPEHFVRLTQLLAGISHLQMLIVGGTSDIGNAARMEASANLVGNVTGRTSLRETFALVARADLVICNSSMLMHVAAAFGVPAYVLLGECFLSARQHATQWGYPGLTRVLGKDRDRSAMYLPEEVFKVICSENAMSPVVTNI
jgi:heptosyltransferase-2